jgi:hypothetical protein
MARAKLWLGLLAGLVGLGAIYRLTRPGIPASDSVADSATLPSSTVLEGLLIEGRRARPEEFDRVQVTRRGQPRPAAPGMALEQGDRVRIGGGGTALLTVPSGYELILESESEIAIGGSEILFAIGKLIGKKIREAAGQLRIGTEYVSAGVEGTEFVLQLDQVATLRIAVLEGRVVVTPKQAGWPPARFDAGEAGLIRRNAEPERMPGLDQPTIDDLRTRTTRIEEILRKTGALLLKGTGAEHYDVLDSTGTNRLVAYRATNSVTELLPGQFVVVLNGRQHAVSIAAGQQTEVAAGTFRMTGTGAEHYDVLDSTGTNRLVAYRATNSDTELLPGNYLIKLGNRSFPVRIRAGQRVTIP